MPTVGARPGLLTRDLALVLGARGTRAFGLGCLSVLLGVHLQRLGLSGAQVGAVLTAALAGSTLASLVASGLADRLGRRRLLFVFGALMAGAAVAFAFVHSFPLLVLLAFAGTFGASGQEPFLTIEHAIIPQTCPPSQRNNAFAAFSLVGAAATALGALASALPGPLERGGLETAWAFRTMFIGFGALVLVMLALHARLSSGVEAPLVEQLPRSPGPRPRGLLARLTALFALDSFAGGLVVQSFLSYWLFSRFGVAVEQLALVFFVGGSLAALSFPVSAWLANRIGQVPTMVFTHLPANVFLILVPLMPTAPLAVIFLLARLALSSMDIPARQAYIVSVVPAGQRTAAAGVTGVVRSLAAVPGPSLAGALMQAGALSLPFFLAGGLKIAYDLTLFALFRGEKPLAEGEAPPRLGPAH
ncbi:MAG: MFS transporter [Chloroflexi bacterium]|nr:MFS transporter [Chloroflexota bacterium]